MSGSGAALLLLLGFLSRCRGAEEIKKLTGSNVTFTAEASVVPLQIIWYKDESIIVDVEQGKPEYFYKWHDRVIVDLGKRTFTLKIVTPEDNGLYRASAVVEGIEKIREFRLQVYDHVCEVAIHHTTAGNNVTLPCMCSSGGASPTRFGWYNGSDHLVSEEQNITLRKKTEAHIVYCIASNEVSENRATFTVPPETPEPERSHVVLMVVLPVIAALAVLGVLVLFVQKYNRKQSVKVEGQQRNQVDPEAGGAQGAKEEEHKLLEDDRVMDVMLQKTKSLTPCGRVDFLVAKKTASKIIFRKAENILMDISLNLQSLCLENLSVQRGSLKIMDVKEEDYGTYTAEVQPPIERRNTFKFHASKSAQNGKSGAPDDPSDRGAELVYPKGGVLNMQIANAENAKEIIWKKNDERLLTVTCGSDPLLENLALYKGAFSMDLNIGDNGPYSAEVFPPDGHGHSACYKFETKVNKEEGKTELHLVRLATSKPSEVDGAALDFGNVTLCPVSVIHARKIIWKKEGKTIAEWEAPNKPQYPTAMKASLDPASGHLTLKNVQEEHNVTYTVEINDAASVQTFIVTIKLETAF